MRINYTKSLSSRIFIYSFLKEKHNLSMKTQFLHRVLYNFAPFILPSSPYELFFSFNVSKGIIFFLKTSYLNLKHVYKMYFERSLDPCEYDVRRLERLVPPQPRSQGLSTSRPWERGWFLPPSAP